MGELRPGSPACQANWLQGPGCAGPGPAGSGSPQAHWRAPGRDPFPDHDFGLIGRDLRTTQEVASDSARSTDPLDGPAPTEPDPGRSTLAPRSPRIQGAPEDVHAMGYLWFNLLAQALHMAALRPTILGLTKAQSRAGPKDPPFHDYARQVLLPAHGTTGAGLEVYVRVGITTRASLLWSKEDANALLMEVLTRGVDIMCWRPTPPRSTLA